MMDGRWRIVMVQETGERVQYGRGTFGSSDAACRAYRAATGATA